MQKLKDLNLRRVPLQGTALPNWAKLPYDSSYIREYTDNIFRETRVRIKLTLYVLQTYLDLNIEYLVLLARAERIEHSHRDLEFPSPALEHALVYRGIERIRTFAFLLPKQAGTSWLQYNAI